MRKQDSIKTSIIAFLSLFSLSKNRLTYLTGIDMEKEKVSNIALKNADENAVLEISTKITNNEIDKNKLCQKRIRRSIVIILIAAILALIESRLICEMNDIRQSIRFISSIFSICFFSFGTICRIGWEGQSYKGDSVYEQLDNRIFIIAYFLGTNLGILAIIL